MGEVSEEKMTTTDSFRVFAGSFFVHTSPEILTKHNIKETDSKGNIWGLFIYPNVRVQMAVKE